MKEIKEGKIKEILNRAENHLTDERYKRDLKAFFTDSGFQIEEVSLLIDSMIISQ